MRIFLFCSAILLLLSSCSMEMETTLNADGSGEESFTLDMSSMSQLAGLFEGAMESDTLNEQVLEDNIDKNLNEEEVMKILEGETEEEDFNLSKIISNPASMGNLDTTFVLYETLTDSLRGLPNAELMKNVKFIIVGDSVTDKSTLGFNLKFASQEERIAIRQELPNFIGRDGEEEKMNNTGTPNLSDNLFGEQEQIDLKRGLIIIPAMAMDEEEESEEEEIDMSDEDTKAMMNMFFGDSGIKSIYHLPGEIEFTSDPEAVIEGKTVTFYTSFTQLMEGDGTPKRVIKFKPKR